MGRRALGLACLCLLAVAAIAGPGAAAAAECPNEAIRAQQGAGHLPECRAWEQVSPVDKGPYKAWANSFGISTDGDRVDFNGEGGFPGAQNGYPGSYMSERTPTGWQAVSLLPPFVRRNSEINDEVKLKAVSTDLSRALFLTKYPLDPDDQGKVVGRGNPGDVPNSDDLYRRDADGSFTWVSRPVTLPDLSPEPVEFVAASGDLSRILMRSKRVLAPPIVGETVKHLYLYVEGRPTQLVDVDPAGNPTTERPAETTAISEEPPALPTAQMSADGTRVAFVAGPTAALKLYLRLDADDPARAHTVDIGEGTEGRTCTKVTLVKLSADGGHVLFECPDQLTDVPLPAGPAGSQGLYLRDLADGSLRLLGRTTVTRVLGATPDLSDVYLSLTTTVTTISGGVGVDGKDWGAVAYLHDGSVEAAVTLPAPNVPTFSLPATSAYWMSANGRYLAFTSAYPLGFPTPAQSSQVYRYDGVTGELSCVSCGVDLGPAGAPLNSQVYPHPSYQVLEGAVSDEGEVFFDTPYALVPRDQNGSTDAYAWRDGRFYLLGSGSDPYGTTFLRASADGRDAFFLTTDSLLAQDRDGGVIDLYDARRDGGFPTPEESVPCGGDACQGPPAPAPAAGAVGSAGFSGAGDEAPPTRPPAVSLASHHGGGDVVATLRVKVHAAGRVSLSGGSVRPVGRKASAGTGPLPVRLMGPARKTLRRKGKLTVGARVGFTPDSGTGGDSATSVRLGFTRSRSGQVTVRMIRGGK